MAGSYTHCSNDDGTFNEENFMDMIENLGDAHEACEMMHWMISDLANGDRRVIEGSAERYYVAKRAEYVR